MNDLLAKSILVTLSYFDMFDYPLAAEEISTWLFDISKIKDVTADIDHELRIKNQELWHDILDKLVQEKLVEQKDDYYFLPGREKIIQIRQQRKLISLQKIKKARRMVRILSLVPGVKMICICSNLACLNADEGADIDLFIVARENRIWTARWWCVLLMKLLNQRPRPGNIKDKICLSYFVTEDNLDLESTAVDDPDIHLIYLISQYLPIYVEDNLWEKFIRENKWIKNYLPNFSFKRVNTIDTRRFIAGFASLGMVVLIRLKQLISQTQFGFEEQLYKKIQLKIMPDVLKNIMNDGSNKVIINDKMLKLHINDKRMEYNKMINDKY